MTTERLERARRLAKETELELPGIIAERRSTELNRQIARHQSNDG